MTEPRWTDADLVLAHEVGRAYERHLIEQAAEDLWTAPSLRPSQPSREQQIADRMELFEACAEELASKLAARQSSTRSTPR